MDKSKLLQDATTLFLVINPFGAIPHYLLLTRGMTRAERLRIAARACIVATVILVAFIFIGEIVLEELKVGLIAFRIAGGLLLLVIAFRMVLETRATPAPPEGEERMGVAVFPLATPLLAGPGSIIAAVLLTENAVYSLGEQAITGLIVVAILAFAFAVLAAADFLQRVLGTTGTSVMSRVFGLLLAALAMQTILDGLRPYIQSLR